MERPQCAFSMLHKWDDEESKKSDLIITFTYRTSKTSKVLPFSHSISSGFTPYIWFFVVLSVLSVTYKGNLVYCFHLDDSLVVMCFFHCMPCHSHSMVLFQERKIVVQMFIQRSCEDHGLPQLNLRSFRLRIEIWCPEKIMIYGVSYLYAYTYSYVYCSINQYTTIA